MSQLLQNAAYGAALILAVALLRRALGSRLVPEARLALWAACLFRLLTPAAPESALSLWGPLSRWFGAVGPAPAAPSAPQLYVLPHGVPAPESGIPWERLLSALWLAAGAALAARYVLSWRRTRRAVSCAIPLERGDRRYAALPKCARLREGPMEGAPLTFGVVRPTVVLSPDLDGMELACVLAHEGVHARRRDNLWHYAAAAALTVFWWDPAVWLMARLIRRDVELSCDRAAVRRLGADRRAEYAAALVTLSTQAEGGAFCHSFGPKRTEERIISVMKYKKTTVTGIALTLALVLAVTVGFASNPGTGIPDEESTTSSAPVPLVWIGSFGPEGELLKFTIGMDYLEQLLMEHVDNGSMTEEGAAYYLGAAKALSQDGVKLEWTVPENIKLFVDKGSMEMTFNIYWLDKNGNKVYLDPVEMLTAYVFAPKDTPSSSGLFVDSAEAEDDFVCYDSTSDPDIILKEYKAVLDRAVARGVRTQAEADEMLANMKTLIELAKKGEIEGLMFNKQADGEASFVEKAEMYVCTQEDCDVSGPHWHENGEVIHYYNTLPAYIDDQEQDEPPTCLREDCPIQPSIHFHNKDGSVSYISNDLPSYVVENSAGDGGGPIACPPDAIDKDFYQKYGDSHHSGGHHQDSHH